LYIPRGWSTCSFASPVVRSARRVLRRRRSVLWDFLRRRSLKKSPRKLQRTRRTSPWRWRSPFRTVRRRWRWGPPPRRLSSPREQKVILKIPCLKFLKKFVVIN